MRKKYVTFIITIIFGICLVITGISVWNKYFIRKDYNENPPEVTQEEVKYSDENGYCKAAYKNEDTYIDKDLGKTGDIGQINFRVKMLDYNISRSLPYDENKIIDSDYTYSDIERACLDDDYTFISDYVYVTIKFEIENTREDTGNDILNQFPFNIKLFAIQDNYIPKEKIAEVKVNFNSKNEYVLHKAQRTLKKGEIVNYTMQYVISDKYENEKLAIRLCDKNGKYGDSYFMLFDEE